MHPLDLKPIELKQGLHLAIVDLDSAIYRCSAVHNDDEEQGLEFSIDTLRCFIQDNIVNPIAAKNYLFAISSDDNFRYKVATSKPYKGQRKGEKPVHYESLLAWAKKEYNCLTVKGVEADDVVVAAHHKYQGSSILVGIDKDNLQSPGWHYDYSKQEARFLLPIDAQYSLAYQMLAGDAGDNITGVPRVGDKGARAQLDQFECPFDAVWAMYKEKGLPWEYYAEQYQLLYMRRDILVPFEDYFVQLEALSEVEPIEDEEDKELEFMSNSTNENPSRKSLKVAFRPSLKSYIAGLDQLYSYQTEDDLEVGEVIKVETPKGFKQAVVVSIDKVFNGRDDKRFNGLANAYKDKS